ncbi:hypothetical protein RB653_009494 [Dictyostelium firmibasis]|uniref:C2 domain-containing protein n=1 Tax=Dictyostelium firmibasis TaxID=79012 RepID=A0AAN7U174_9MYCE
MSNVSSNIFNQIATTQVNAGNFGGRDGPLGHYATSEKKKGGKKVEDFKIIRFTITKGDVFKAWDSNGLADPKVIVYLLKKKDDGTESKKLLFKTNVCKKTLKPDFNFSEMYKIPVKAIDILMELWDDDLIKDDFIGSCKIPINFTDFPNASNYVLLDKDNFAQGNVSLMMHKLEKNGHNLLNVKN